MSYAKKMNHYFLKIQMKTEMKRQRKKGMMYDVESRSRQIIFRSYAHSRSTSQLLGHVLDTDHGKITPDSCSQYAAQQIEDYEIRKVKKNV